MHHIRENRVPKLPERLLGRKGRTDTRLAQTRILCLRFRNYPTRVVPVRHRREYTPTSGNADIERYVCAGRRKVNSSLESEEEPTATAAVTVATG